MPHDTLEPWHDFFVLVGTAAATLVGLTFVAASVGSGVFTRERQVGLRSFLSPTVVAFTIVLAACLIGLAPVHEWGVAGAAIIVLGAFGIVYSGLVLRSMFRAGIAAQIDMEDRVWYAVAPCVSYLLLAGAGVCFILALDLSALALAVAMGLLLITGIRNVWDMTTWIVLQRPNA